VPDEALGRLRGSPGAVARVEGVSALLTGSTDASALVLAAVVHAELATVQPFGSADALVARAAEHLVLIAAGVDPQGLVPVEAGHAASSEAYAAGLQGYAHGGVAGVRAWLLQCTTALGRGAELLGARLAAPGPAGT
jgi:Fic family protein